MNNDQCVYHVRFLLRVGGRTRAVDEGMMNRRGDRCERYPAQLSTAKPGQRKGEGKHVIDGIGGRGEG